jgi:tripartite motif-containing protein 2/3/tripartite motif-containing protein 71
MFGRRGQGRGELDGPAVVALDTSDMVYVSEGDNQRVSVFTSDGQFVMAFGRMGEGPGEFKEPRGLAVDNSGVVYVCDIDNNRVQVF